MAIVGINHTFKFYLNEFSGYETSKHPPKLVPGDDNIPESKWEFSYKENKDGTWNLYVDLKNYLDFKTGNVSAVGGASLVWPHYGYGFTRGCCQPNLRPSSVERKSSVKYLCAEDKFKLQITTLKHLESARVWSFENVILKSGNVPDYDFMVNIVLFANSNKQSKMQTDFNELLQNGLYADLILVSEGKEFKVHKTILCARSNVFRAMLKADMKEKNESKVDISDVKSGVLEKMLMYIYTGTYECSGESAGY